MVLDRLPHLPDTPEILRAQAAQRAEQLSPREFFTWLADTVRKAQQSEPAEPLWCDCGAGLLDPSAWAGRAAVHCDRCGARWGVEVTDAETWSMWSLDGPSESDVDRHSSSE